MFEIAKFAFWRILFVVKFLNFPAQGRDLKIWQVELVRVAELHVDRTAKNKINRLHI